jgi:hypothetical protein
VIAHQKTGLWNRAVRRNADPKNATGKSRPSVKPDCASAKAFRTRQKRNRKCILSQRAERENTTAKIHHWCAVAGGHQDVPTKLLDKMNAIEEVIVVGIHPNDRMSEYTLPGYQDYGRFLVETLKPLIDAKYRTLTGPSHTAAMGSSLGGVVSFYLGWQWSEVFGKVALPFEHIWL